MCDNNGSSTYPTTTDQRPQLICKICSKTEKIRRCSRCQTAFYCSNVCQRLDWPYHKSQCHKREKPEKANASKSTTTTTPLMPIIGQEIVAPVMTMQQSDPMINVPVIQQQQQQEVSFFAPYCRQNGSIGNAATDNISFDDSLDIAVDHLLQQQQQSSTSSIYMDSPDVATGVMEQQQIAVEVASMMESEIQPSSSSALLLDKALDEMIENGLDLREELNDIFFGKNGELADLQLDVDDHNQFGIGQENTMHISNESFINNTDLNMPFRLVK